MDIAQSGSQLAAVRKYWVLAVVSLTTFMVFVDATVVNTAMPSIAREFGATSNGSSTHTPWWLRASCSSAGQSATATGGKKP